MIEGGEGYIAVTTPNPRPAGAVTAVSLSPDPLSYRAPTLRMNASYTSGHHQCRQ